VTLALRARGPLPIPYGRFQRIKSGRKTNCKRMSEEPTVEEDTQNDEQPLLDDHGIKSVIRWLDNYKNLSPPEKAALLIRRLITNTRRRISDGTLPEAVKEDLQEFVDIMEEKRKSRIVDLHQTIRGNKTGEEGKALEIRIPKVVRNMLGIDENTLFNVKVDVEQGRLILEILRDSPKVRDSVETRRKSKTLVRT
jgi:hypothetical protein